MLFNKQQLKAVNFYKGNIAVVAGAGSGKTSCMKGRVANLVDNHEVQQKDILVISFTKNTANELKNSLIKMGYPRVKVGTYHAICGEILRQHGINTSKKILEWQIENCFHRIDKKADIDDISSYIGYQKNYLKSYDDEFMPKDSNYSEEELRVFFKEYEMFKKKNGLYDFEDDLIECYKLLHGKKHNNSWEFVMVDEHQDSNLVQNLLLKEFSKSGNLFCVFDYRQAIYTFRGGNPEYCMNFDKEWDNATVINLDINYRSCKNIVKKANSFINKYYGDYEHYSDSISNNENNGHIETNIYSCKQEEANEIVDKIEHIIHSGGKLNDIAVLYRLNSQVSFVENELKSRNIPYFIDDKSSFFKRTEINLIMSYLRLIDNPHDNGALENIFKSRNYPFKFLSNATIEDIKTRATQKNESFYESLISFRYKEKWETKNAQLFEDNINSLRLQCDKGLPIENIIENIKILFKLNDFLELKYSNEEEIQDRKNSIEVLKTFIKGNNLERFIAYVYNNNEGKKKADDCVKLMTIHASKGLEFEDVFLIGIEDSKFPHVKSSLIDEARLFYVGITRAKQNLYLSELCGGNQFMNEYIGNDKQKLVC